MSGIEAGRGGGWIGRTALGAVGIVLGLMVNAAIGQAAESPGESADRAISFVHVVDDGGQFADPQGAFFYDARGPVPAEARVIEVAGSDVCVAVWHEARADGGSVPWYGVSLDGQTYQRVATADYSINLAGFSFDPLAAPGSAEALPPLPAELTAPGPLKPQAPSLKPGGDRRLFIVQFWTQSLSVYREQIEALGGTIHRYLPAQAHLVEMDAAVRDAVAALPFVRWVGAYHPAYRLEPALREALTEAESGFRTHTVGWPSDSGIKCNVMVCERGPRQKEIVAERIEELGGTIDLLTPSGFRLEATLTPEQLLAVVRMDEVLFVDRWSEPVACMDVARQIGGANLVEGVAGYTGAGVRGEVVELGSTGDPTHQDFQHDPPLIHGPGPTNNSHGTSTYGIIFGDGAGNPAARGLLPDGQGIMAESPVDHYAHTAELLAEPYNAVFQSHSYGTVK